MQALKEGKLRPQILQPQEGLRPPGLSTLILDEADLILSMPGYDEDLQAIAPKVSTSRLQASLMQSFARLCLQDRVGHESCWFSSGQDGGKSSSRPRLIFFDSHL